MQFIESLKYVLASINDYIRGINDELAQSAGTVDPTEIDEILAGSQTSERTIRNIVTYTETWQVMSNDDVWKWVEMDSEYANNYVLPSPTEFEPAVGVTVMVRQMGAGATTIVASDDVTILSPYESTTISKRYACIGIQYRGNGVYCVEGAFAEA